MNTKISIEEYSVLRNMESLVSNLYRVDATSLRALKRSWLWSAILEQLKQLARIRAEAQMRGDKE